MSRLKEADIRRIIREENARNEVRQSKVSTIPDDIRKTHAKFMDLPLLARTGYQAGGTTLAGELDWILIVEQVINTYWEVVEEDLNDG